MDRLCGTYSLKNLEKKKKGKLQEAMRSLPPLHHVSKPAASSSEEL